VLVSVCDEYVMHEVKKGIDVENKETARLFIKTQKK
jgi:hypothetical protein